MESSGVFPASPWHHPIPVSQGRGREDISRASPTFVHHILALAETYWANPKYTAVNYQTKIHSQPFCSFTSLVPQIHSKGVRILLTVTAMTLRNFPASRLSEILITDCSLVMVMTHISHVDVCIITTLEFPNCSFFITGGEWCCRRRPALRHKLIQCIKGSSNYLRVKIAPVPD